MDNDIISLFLNRKKSNISKYTEVFAKYTLKNNVNLTKIVNKIVEIYMNKFYLSGNKDFSLLSKYFEFKDNKESVIKNVLLSSIIFYKNSGLEEQIAKDIKTIVILSNLIYLSLSLDEYTNEYKNTEEVELRVDLFFSKFQKKIKVSEDNLELLKEELLSLVKKDIMVEKKFWKSLADDSFNLKYKKSIKDNNYYLVDYYYDIKTLNRYDKNEVKLVSNTKGIYDDMLSIFIEKQSVFMLKNLLSKNYDDIFFMTIYPDYFNKNKDILKLDSVFNNDNVKNRIVFMFEYSDLKNNLNVIKSLVANNYLLGLKNIPSNAKINTNDFDYFKYIFTDSSFISKYSDYEEVWKVKEIKFIIDDEFVNIMDSKILLGTR